MSAKPRPTTPVPPTLIIDEERSAKPWSVELTLPQIIIGWSAIGAMMVLVFLFGLYSGRNHGMELALEEQATPRLRLPITDTKVRELPKAVEAKEDRFDFADAAPIVAKEEQAGFVAKPAEVGKVLADAEKTAAPSAETLSERVASVELSSELSNALKQPVAEKPVEKVKTTPPVVEKVADKKPQVVSKPATPVAKGSYFVQLAAPDSMDKAQSLVSRLRSKGITAVVRDAKVNNKLHFRVLVGPYSTSQAANEARSEVVRSGVVAGQPFVKKY